MDRTAIIAAHEDEINTLVVQMQKNILREEAARRLAILEKEAVQCTAKEEAFLSTSEPSNPSGEDEPSNPSGEDEPAPVIALLAEGAAAVPAPIPTQVHLVHVKEMYAAIDWNSSPLHLEAKSWLETGGNGCTYWKPILDVLDGKQMPGGCTLQKLIMNADHSSHHGGNRVTRIGLGSRLGGAQVSLPADPHHLALLKKEAQIMQLIAQALRSHLPPPTPPQLPRLNPTLRP